MRATEGVEWMGLDVAFVRVRVPRERMILWVERWLAKQEALFAERDAEIRARLEEKNVARDLLENMSVWRVQSVPDLPSHEQAELEQMLRRVAGLRTEIKNGRSILLGLRHGVDDVVEIPLHLLEELEPEA